MQQQKKISRKTHKVMVLVKEVLTRYPMARENDYLLYAYVLNRYNISMHTDYFTIMEKVKRKEIPCFETVGRTRRKLQEMYSDLRAPKEVEAGRNKKEEEFLALAQLRSI